MADKGAESFRPLEIFDVSRIILIQSYIRGALVRKWMRELRQAYLDLVVGVERTSIVHVAWEHDSLCGPQIVKGQQALQLKAEAERVSKKKTWGNKPSAKSQKNVPPKISVMRDAQVSTSGLNFYTSGLMPDDSKSNSVEIQTSFIDLPDNKGKQYVSRDVRHLDKSAPHNTDDNILDCLDTSWKDRVEPFLKNNFEERSDKDSASQSQRNSENDLRLQLDSARESELSSLKTPESRLSLDSDRSGHGKSPREGNRNKYDYNYSEDRNDNLEKYKRNSGNSKGNLESDNLEIQSMNSERSACSEKSDRSASRENDEVKSLRSHRSENSQQTFKDKSQNKHQRNANEPNIHISERHLGRKTHLYVDDFDDENLQAKLTDGNRVLDKSNKRQTAGRTRDQHLSERPSEKQHLNRNNERPHSAKSDMQNSDRFVEKQHSDQHNERKTSERSRERQHSERSNERQHSERSNERQHSERSNERQHSERSNERQHSERLNERQHSERSIERQHSERSNERQHSERSNERQHSERSIERQHSQRSNERQHSQRSKERQTSERSERSSRNRRSSGDRNQEDCRVTDRSNKSDKDGRSSQRSRKSSKERLDSDRYDGSNKSRETLKSTEKYEDRRVGREMDEGQRSHRSDRSVGERSRSARSERNEGQMSTRREERMSPRHSARSPVPSGTNGSSSRQPTVDHGPADHVGQQRDSVNSTALTNVTSVWDSFNSVRESHEPTVIQPLPRDANQLKEIRKNVSMELLWIQQAIDSRKNYLRLKGKM